MIPLKDDGSYNRINQTPTIRAMAIDGLLHNPTAHGEYLRRFKKYVIVFHGNHWGWSGGRTGGEPRFNVFGKPVQSKRFILALMSKTVPTGKISQNCDFDDHCLNPDHLELEESALDIVNRLVPR